MQFNADTCLIEAARQIAPVIRAHNEEAERERRLSRPVLEALYATGLLRMSTPRTLGGLEADPITRALVIEEIAGHDTAAGWTLANPLDWAHFCARLPDAGAEEIYSSGANILIAAQFGRPLNAIPAQDGYRITGRAPFVSNCYDADWIAVTALVMDGDPSQEEDKGEPGLVMVYFPRAQCQVIDTWHVMGMRGTGSHDISVTDVFVPKVRTFPMVPEFEPGLCLPKTPSSLFLRQLWSLLTGLIPSRIALVEPLRRPRQWDVSKLFIFSYEHASSVEPTWRPRI